MAKTGRRKLKVEMFMADEMRLVGYVI